MNGQSGIGRGLTRPRTSRGITRSPVLWAFFAPLCALLGSYSPCSAYAMMESHMGVHRHSAGQEGDGVDFVAVVDQVIALLAPAGPGDLSHAKAPVQVRRRPAGGPQGRTPLPPTPGDRGRGAWPGLDGRYGRDTRPSPAPSTSAPSARPHTRAEPRARPSADPVPPRPNAASSPCCFATWWGRPRSPAARSRRLREVVRAYGRPVPG